MTLERESQLKHTQSEVLASEASPDSSIPGPSAPPPGRPSPDPARRQIRGSSLLLIGRLFSLGLNFLTQVLIVNHLSKGDFGTFAYGLSVVALGETLITFGLDRAVTRFAPIYLERREYPKLFGTLVMVTSTITLLGMALIVGTFVLQDFLTYTLIGDRHLTALLLVMIGLSPLQALDNLIIGIFAVFASPRSIFFRKHMLAPLFRMGVVALLIANRSDVFFLASGYVVATVAGVAISAWVLFRLLRQQGVLRHFDLGHVQLPVRELLAFTIPLLTSDLVYTVMNTIDVVLLEHFQSAAAVAAFRAVQPAARLNQVVLTSFALLFTPAMARLFAQNDHKGINHLYWQTAVWSAIVSFPVFAISFGLAGPLTLLLFGERYADSAVILSLLSFGYYFDAALGQNGLTLKVFGKMKYIVAVNLLAAVVNLGINLLLIPQYGALGAALGTSITLVAFNIFKQISLWLSTGVNPFDRRYLKTYIVITLGVGGLALIQWVTLYSMIAGFVLVGLIILAVVWLNRKSLNIAQTFPEVLRLPLMRRLLRD